MAYKTFPPLRIDPGWMIPMAKGFRMAPAVFSVMFKDELVQLGYLDKSGKRRRYQWPNDHLTSQTHYAYERFAYSLPDIKKLEFVLTYATQPLPRKRFERLPLVEQATHIQDLVRLLTKYYQEKEKNDESV